MMANCDRKCGELCNNLTNDKTKTAVIHVMATEIFLTPDITEPTDYFHLLIHNSTTISSFGGY